MQKKQWLPDLARLYSKLQLLHSKSSNLKENLKNLKYAKKPTKQDLFRAIYKLLYAILEQI